MILTKYITPFAAALALPKSSSAFYFSPLSSQAVNSDFRCSTYHNALQTAFTRKAGHRMVRSETTLLAKKGGNKRRRRRKDGGNMKQKIGNNALEPKISENKQVINRDDDALPDFDLVEDVDLPLSDEAQVAADSMPIDMNDPDAVLDAMKVKNEIMPSSSTVDLLKSRNIDLERSVVDNVTQKVPSLAEYTRKSATSQPGGGEKIGKKAARAAVRREAAIEAEKSEMSAVESFMSKLPPPVESLLSKVRLPFFTTVYDQKGNLSPFKIVENAAWAGIYTLVVWEIYINSPLFQRAAPLAPFVFRDPPPMT